MERICIKCDTARDVEAFPRRGKGRHSWCCFCLSAYQKARRGPPKKKPKPWLNPRRWEGHRFGELFLKYEDAVSRTALLTVKAMTASGKERKQAWAAAYRAGSQRDELRVQVMEVLIP